MDLLRAARALLLTAPLLWLWRSFQQRIPLHFHRTPQVHTKKLREKKMQVLWLRYLTEIDENTREIPKELLDNPEIGKAVEKLEESAFTEKELLAYDKFWDTISTSRLLLIGAMRRGMKEGMEKGLEKGRKDEKIKIARSMKAEGFPPETIARITGLTVSEITGI